MSSIDRLGAFLAQDPANPLLACQLCDALIAAGQVAAADRVLAQLPDISRDDPGVAFRRARVDLLSGRYASAEATLRTLTQHTPAPAIAHDIAFAQLCQRDLAGATATLAEARQHHGPSADFAVLAARVALMQHDEAAAAAALDEALQLDPGHATALGLRALAHLDADRPQQAWDTAVACLAAHPDQHEALLTTGSVRLYRQDADQASADFERALARFPHSGRALSGLGQACMLRGDLDRARALLEAAAQAMPDHIGTWHALGWLQLLRGERQQAERSYRQAHALDRNFAESHGGLAVVALLEGRTEGETAMRIALRLDPRSISGRYARTLWLQDRGDAATAAAEFAALVAEGALAGAIEVTDADPAQMAMRLRARLSAPRHAG